ncbi:MAG: helix-hairpin-helix domain-containing protein [Chloroflexota bacterium]
MPSREPTPFALVAALLIVAVTIVGGMVLVMASRPAPVTITINPPPPTPTIVPSATPSPLMVYVTGAVNQPGVVTLPASSRIQDVLAAAGGAAPDADLERIDLAALVSDGDHIHVYRDDEAAQTVDNSQSSSSENATSTVVHVNRATLEELETLPGIGPVLAQRIIDYRTANGKFTTLESLKEVSGIGDHVAQGINGLVVFD